MATAIQMGATVFDLEETELCYAPQFGSAKDPVNIAGFVAGNILRGDVAPANWSDWKALAAKGETPVTLDVRPPSAVAADAIPGTIRIPLAELRSRLEELPRDREIWVHCVVGQTSYNAVRMLAQHGFKVRNLSGGITTFKMEGYANRSCETEILTSVASATARSLRARIASTSHVDQSAFPGGGRLRVPR